MTDKMDIKQQILSRGFSGLITVRNDGQYKARFEVSYQLNTIELSQNSGRFGSGEQRSLNIPKGAKNLVIKADEQINSHPGIWKEIFTMKYPYAGERNFRLWGTNLYPRYGLIIPEYNKA